MQKAPSETRRWLDDMAVTLKRTPSAALVVMKVLGHFPMSEKTTAFRPYFQDALELMRISQTELMYADGLRWISNG
ncbi:hypothetical protein [Rhizobium mayense]|uniref:Uncharacterized protein n=1 Tax=Rhizobium mayense TaxID=1312184 RepID=A0ABT7JXG3_9HYPH|nr:hypothetical protein [Rhizobium mayense]MDL2401005.1 hypothetical protein [Rhizobium mayense]